MKHQRYQGRKKRDNVATLFYILFFCLGESKIAKCVPEFIQKEEFVCVSGVQSRAAVSLHQKETVKVVWACDCMQARGLPLEIF